MQTMANRILNSVLVSCLTGLCLAQTGNDFKFYNHPRLSQSDFLGTTRKSENGDGIATRLT